MVIFDTENKRKKDLGVLYLSVSDIDYLIKIMEHLCLHQKSKPS